VLRETNGIGVIIKHYTYWIKCEDGIWSPRSSELAEEYWVRIKPFGEGIFNINVPQWPWNCDSVPYAWLFGYDDYGNKIEVIFSYKIKGR